MVTVFHRQLTLDFFRNLIRTLLALTVAVGAFHALTLDFSDLNFSGFFLVILARILPMALLVATLFTVGTVARYHELTALKAAGWPLHLTMWPLLLVGLVSVPLSIPLYGAERAVSLVAESDLATMTALHAERVRPVINILAVVLGISLGATRRQRTMFSGFLAGALVLAGYFVVSATAQALGRHGFLPPIVAGWSPLVLFSGLAWVLWGRASS